MTAGEWKNFYNDIQEKNGISFETSKVKEKNKLTIFDSYVDLKEVLKEANSIRMIKVYADVLRIPKNFSYVLKEGYLYLFARHIIVEENTNILLDYRENKNSKFIIYYQNIDKKLKINCIYKKGEEEKTYKEISYLEQLEKGRIGKIFQFRQIKDIEAIPEIDFSIIKEIELLMKVQFQIATITSYSMPEIAQDILNWMIALTKNSKVKTELFLKLSTLRNLIYVRENGYKFVPILNKDTYYQEINRYVDLLKDFEMQYQIINNRNLNLEDRKNSLSLLFTMSSNYDEFKNYSLEQAKNNFQAALESDEIANQNLKSQTYILKNIKNIFYIELEHWYKMQKIDFAVKILKEVIEFTFSVVTLIAGIIIAGPIGAMPAAGSASKSTNMLTMQQANALEQFKKFIDIYNESTKGPLTISEKWSSGLEAIISTKDSVENTITTFCSLADAVNEIISYCDPDNIKEKVEINNFTITDMDTDNGLAYWAVYKTSIDTIMEEYKKLGVPKIKEFSEEFKKYIIYGETTIRTKAAVIRAGQEYANLLLESSIGKENEKEIQESIQKITKEELENKEFILALSEKVIQLKEWLAIAMENYRASYEYWTLSKLEIPIQPNKSVIELKSDLMKIFQGYKKVLENLNPPPQKFKNVFISVNKKNCINFNQIKKDLQEKKEVVIPILLEEKEFMSQSRIRIDIIRVWLNGIHYKDKKILIHICTSGNYIDKKNKEIFYFTSISLKRDFQYKQTDNEVRIIQKDGVIDEEFKKYYFQPTPFTQWCIKVETEDDIDFSTLTDITLEFEGISNS